MRKLGVVAVLAFALVGCSSSGSTPAASAPTVKPTAAPTAVVTSFPFTLPTSGPVLFFGDSWTYGFYATPVTNGFAYLTAADLHLTPDVQGVGGTGFLNPGPPPGEGTYLQRLAKLPASSPALVVVQCSYNDLTYPAAAVTAAAGQFITAIRGRFPKAQMVVVGPGTPNPGHESFVVPKGISLDQLDQIDAKAAAADRLDYISPVREQWFTAANAAQVLTNKLHPHPSNAGHALIATRLVADLRKLAQTGSG